MEEQIELPENQQESPLQPLMHISEDARYYWPATRNWSLFMSVICFVGAGLIALFMVFLSMLANSYGAPSNLGSSLVVDFVWLVIAVAIGVLLLRFSNSLNRAYRYGHPDDIERSTGTLLNYFRVLGVISIFTLLIQIVLLFSLMALANRSPF